MRAAWYERGRRAPLSDIALAHELVERGTRGRVVVVMP
jgi:hypothetical protein